MAVNDKGFTLIEMVLSITLLGLVAVTIGMLIYQGTKSYDMLSSQKEIAQQGALAMERLSRELRLVRCTEAGSSCTPSASDILAMTASEVRFVTTDLEGRGFRLDGNTLKARDGSGALDPEYALTDRVTSLTFEYLQDDGSAASTPSEVWLIDVEMTLSDGTESFPLKARVHPRSFR